jgi:nucleotide-binding universal stress UspA family protein
MTLALIEPVVRFKPEQNGDFEAHSAKRIESINHGAPRVILHPTDYSETSQWTFELACRLARNVAGRVIVLHVLSTRGPAPLGMAQGAARRDRSASQERLRTQHPPHENTRIEHWLAEGDAAEEIQHVAREQYCDLILMASHVPVRGFRLRRGIASKVSRKATCPVAVLTAPNPGRPLFDRSQENRRRTAGSSVPKAAMPRLRSILHPTDLSPGADAAFGIAAILVKDAGGELDVLHAIQRPLYFGSRLCRTRAKQKLRRMAQSDTALQLRSHVLPGDPVSETVWLDREMLYDLIVVGRRGHRGLKRLLSGSVSRDIQRRADSPVLTVTVPPSVALKNPMAWADLRQSAL